jgi:hypothetical protein
MKTAEIRFTLSSSKEQITLHLFLQSSKLCTYVCTRRREGLYYTLYWELALALGTAETKYLFYFNISCGSSPPYFSEEDEA